MEALSGQLQQATEAQEKLQEQWTTDIKAVGNRATEAVAAAAAATAAAEAALAGAKKAGEAAEAAKATAAAAAAVAEEATATASRETKEIEHRVVFVPRDEEAAAGEGAGQQDARRLT